jgi:hypothetical protein
MGGSKTAILAQVVHFYLDAVVHITIGANILEFDPAELKIPQGLTIAALWSTATLRRDQSEWCLWGNFLDHG